MKRQSHRTIAAHLMRAASLLVLIFLAVQVIPFAIGQRHIKQKIVRSYGGLPDTVATRCKHAAGSVWGGGRFRRYVFLPFWRLLFQHWEHSGRRQPL
jgi:hypothetical protein